MNNLDIRQLALYLAWSLPPYYDGNKKVRFFRVLNDIDNVSYSIEKLDFFERQAKWNDVEYYFMILEDFYIQNNKTDKWLENISNLLEKLDIPSELYLKKNDKEEELFDRPSLLKAWNILITEENTQKKWDMFEDFLKKLLNSIPWLTILEAKQAPDEQIDLWIKNDIPGTFWTWFWSPIIIGEAKNRTKKTPSEVVNTLKWKRTGHKSVCKIGLVISMNWFTNTTQASADRISNEFTMIFIEKTHIETLLQWTEDILQWFEKIVVNAISA